MCTNPPHENLHLPIPFPMNLSSTPCYSLHHPIFHQSYPICIHSTLTSTQSLNTVSCFFFYFPPVISLLPPLPPSLPPPLSSSLQLLFLLSSISSSQFSSSFSFTVPYNVIYRSLFLLPPKYTPSTMLPIMVIAFSLSLSLYLSIHLFIYLSLSDTYTSYSLFVLVLGKKSTAV